MDIKLYYIEGISRADTPYFSTKGVQASLARQKDYFDRHTVTTISTAFYPPHYMNVVKVDIEDVTFDDTVNYLSLEYNDKEYYYFIDDIEYVSESIIRLHITMDVIQTYMFNIRITNGVIERKFIDRWNNDNTINRNYLRENLSNAEFVYYDFLRLDDPSQYVICGLVIDIAISAPVSGGYDAGIRMSYVANNEVKYINPQERTLPISSLNVIYYPCRMNSTPVNIDLADGNLDFIPSRFLETIAGSTKLQDLFVFPFNPVSSFSITPSGTIGRNNEYGNKLVRAIRDENYGYKATVSEGPIFDWATMSDASIRDYSHKVRLYDEKYSFSFVKNTNYNAVFNPNYMPNMLDNNYIQLAFGSYCNNTSFPLYELATVDLYMHYYGDIYTGNRVYFINTEEHSMEDIHRTTVIDNSKMQVDMLNSPWKDYVAANKGRWIAAGVNTAITVAEAIISYGISTAPKIAAVGKEITKTNNIRYGQARDVNGKFRKGIKRLGADTTISSRNVYGEIPSNSGGEQFATAIGQVVGGLAGQAVSDYNKYYSPQSLKQNSSVTDGLNKSASLFYEIKRVNDYEQCAQYYHRNGYLVNEYVNAIANIFEYVQNRLYFNVLKMNVPEVHLVGVIEDSTTIGLIVDRLETGIRLWNVLPTTFIRISQYRYNHTSYDQEQLMNLCYWSFRIPANDTLKGKTITEVVATTTPTSTSVYDYNFNSSTGELEYRTRASGIFLETTLTSDVSITYHYAETINPVNLGNFMYDNVELKYIN